MVFGLLGPLLVMLGVVVVALRVVNRWRIATERAPGIPLEVLKRVACGPRQGIALVRAGKRVLVVSMGEGGTSLLTELATDEIGDALTVPDVAVTPPRVPRWSAALARLPFVLLVLAVGTAAGPGALEAAVMQDGGPAASASPPSMSLQIGDGDDGLEISGTVGVVVLMTVLTVLPALFLMMTSFTRILIVLHFIRSALGTQTTPPGQLLVAIAVMLTGVVMAPALRQANERALQPYLDGELTQVEAYQAAVAPFREFMLANTRNEELTAFVDMSGLEDAETVDDVPTVTIMSAFVTSELKTAFQIGFVIFLPFTVVDLVVASVLMSMGMFMLPPVMISLPFKLLLFVLADGWTLVVQNLVASFRI